MAIIYSTHPDKKNRMIAAEVSKMSRHAGVRGETGQHPVSANGSDHVTEIVAWEENIRCAALPNILLR
jgi:hypothetical protein